MLLHAHNMGHMHIGPPRCQFLNPQSRHFSTNAPVSMGTWGPDGWAGVRDHQYMSWCMAPASYSHDVSTRLPSSRISSILTTCSNEGLFLASAFQHSSIQLYTVSGQSCRETKGTYTKTHTVSQRETIHHTSCYCTHSKPEINIYVLCMSRIKMVIPYTL